VRTMHRMQVPLMPLPVHGCTVCFTGQLPALCMLFLSKPALVSAAPGVLTGGLLPALAHALETLVDPAHPPAVVPAGVTLVVQPVALGLPPRVDGVDLGPLAEYR
jgi:hypothetical protein